MVKNMTKCAIVILYSTILGVGVVVVPALDLVVECVSRAVGGHGLAMTDQGMSVLHIATVHAALDQLFARADSRVVGDASCKGITKLSASSLANACSSIPRATILNTCTHS